MLKLVGMKPVIVHGGGKEISKWVEKVGKEAEFINGLRVTDAETMEIAEMVLGNVNKSLVSLTLPGVHLRCYCFMYFSRLWNGLQDFILCLWEKLEFPL